MKNVKNIWEQRMPSVLGVLVLAVSIGTIGWLSRNALLLGTKAATGGIPKTIQVSNVSDTSFTVSYITDEKVLGSLEYGTVKSETTAIALDDRDQKTAIPQAYTMHHITVHNLTPATKYYYSITSGDQTFTNGDVPYEITTAPKLEKSVSSQAPLAGTVTLENGAIPAEAIIYASSSASQLFSSLVSADGSYKMELNTIRTINLSELLPFTKDTILRLSVVSPALQSQVSLLASQSNPVPLILLSKDYDFAVSTDALTSPTASSSASESAKQDFPAVEEQTDTSSGPQILSPKADQAFKDQQPLFKGTASPNGEVFIVIQSEQEIQTTVQADDKGVWQYRPEDPLDPGEHTITIETPDLSGVMKKLSQPFTVYAAGSSQFTEPSISPELSLTPTVNASPSPTANQTPTPPLVPTASATATPTFAPSPTASISPTSMQPLAPTGNSTVLMTMLGVASALGIGALLFFFTMI